MNIKCTKCKVVKPQADFWRDSRRASKIAAWCKACKSKDQKRIRSENPDKHRDREIARYWKNKPQEQERHLIRKYGVSFQGYDRMLLEQSGKCAICGGPEPKRKKFDVDHCHTTGKVRGLLCTSCNRMLGHSGDSETVLVAAAEYLQSSRKSRQSSFIETFNQEPE